MSLETIRNELILLGRRHQVNGKFTPAEQHKWDMLNRDYDNLNRQDEIPFGRDNGSIEKGPKSARFQANGGGSVLDRAIAGWSRNQLGEPISADEAAACNAYGVSAQSNIFAVNFAPTMPMPGRKMFNSLSAQDGSAGALTVAGEFMRNLEQAMLDHSGILQVCDVMRTDTGAAMPWPTTDDTSNTGAQIGENAESDVLDPTFKAVVFGSYKLTSKLIKVPHELLRDNAVNLASELGSMLGTRISRILNTKCTTGNGAGTAMGMVTAATLGKTAASATAITFDELIDLQHSVDVSYRTAANGFGWMMHDSVAAYVRKLKDGDGNYLWQQSTQAGQPDRLLGWPVALNNDMASSIVSGAKTVLCGAFRKYKVRLVGSLRLRRLVERYAEFDQEGFLGFQEFDGNLLDAGTHPVKYLAQA